MKGMTSAGRPITPPSNAAGRPTGFCGFYRSGTSASGRTKAVSTGVRPQGDRRGRTGLGLAGHPMHPLLRKDARVTTTLRVILDQIVAPVPGPLGRYTRDLGRAIVAAAPAGCDVEAIVSSSLPDDYDRVKREVPGLSGLYRTTLARRELAAAWQLGITTSPGSGMIHGTSLFAPLRKHDRQADGEPGRRHGARRARVDASRGAQRGIRRLAEGHAQARPQVRRRGRRADPRARRPARQRRRLRRPRARDRGGAALGPGDRCGCRAARRAPRAAARVHRGSGHARTAQGPRRRVHRARPPGRPRGAGRGRWVPRAGATSTWRPSPTRAASTPPASCTSTTSMPPTSRS